MKSPELLLFFAWGEFSSRWVTKGVPQVWDAG
jgi:hypothetical protein